MLFGYLFFRWLIVDVANFITVVKLTLLQAQFKIMRLIGFDYLGVR